MNNSNYLILTKASDAKDIEWWGVDPGNVGLTINSDGTMNTIAEWKNLPDSPRRILVLNIALSNLTTLMEAYADRIAGIVGQSPRLWIHFGDNPSHAMVAKRLFELWMEEQYNPFRRFAAIPMPYSQKSPVDFDRCVKEISDKIKAALSGKLSGILNDMAKVLAGLDDAWEKACNRFQVEDISKAFLEEKRQRIAESLIPVFIYLDGLLYAKDKAHDKLCEMVKVVRESVPEVLRQINGDARNLAKDIRAHVSMLENVENAKEEKLLAMSQTFCGWYRDFLKDAMPESATASETMQETKP